jgi:ABC-type transporter Mla MlaB component
MLRVTRLQLSGSAERLVLEGRLTRTGLPRFEETCHELLAEGVALEIDLAGILFVDPEGVAALQALRRQGAALAGASGFVAALLGAP